MRRFALPLLLVLCLGSLAADLAWSQALEVCAFDNVEYRGSSILTSDGCHLLSWHDTTGEYQQRKIMLFDQQYQPLWQQPLTGIYPYGFHDIFVETVDSAFVLLYSTKAFKISRSGEMLWGPEGIPFLAIGGFASTVNLKADHDGGVYISWTINPSPNRYAMIQHLDSAGNISMPAGGTLLDIIPNQYQNIELMILPDNSALVSWRMSYAVRVVRVDSLGQSLWDQPISISSTRLYPGAILCDFADQSFALIMDSGNSLDVHRFSYSGMALWMERVVVMTQTGTQTGGYSKMKAKLALDGSIYVSARTSGGFYMQKVSADGALQFPSAVHLNQWLGDIDSFSELMVDDQNSCALVVSSGTYDVVYSINVFKVNPSGAVSIHPVTDTTHRNEFPSAHLYGGNMHIEWQRWDEAECGIYVQILDGQMQSTLVPNGMALMARSSGIVQDIQLAATETGSYVLWQQATLRNERWKLYLQRYSNQGQPQWPAQGRQINRPGSRLYSSPKIISNGSNILLLWIEYLDGVYSTRIQIIDESGSFLFGEGGVILNNNSGWGRESVSSYMGDWYVLWVSGSNVFGQKIRGTQYLWGDGLQLTQQDPQNPGGANYCDFSMPWLFWRVGLQLYIKRIDTEGATMPGFPEYGMMMPDITEGYAPYGFHQTTVLGDYLHVFLRLRSPGGAPDINRHTVLGPQGNILFDPAYIDMYGQLNIFAHNNEIWITNTTDAYRVRSYDVAGTLLMNQTISVPGYTQPWAIVSHQILSNGEHLLLAQGSGPTTFSHMYLSDTWELQIPADALLYSCYAFSPDPPLVARLGDRTWVAWANYSDWGMSNTVGISLQKIVRDGLSIQDIETQAPVKPFLTGCSPNPFNPSARISFSIPEVGKTRLAIYDIRGRLIRVLLDGELPAGNHNEIWDGKSSEGRDAASGIYILKLDSKGGSHCCKITLMK